MWAFCLTCITFLGITSGSDHSSEHKEKEGTKVLDFFLKEIPNQDYADEFNSEPKQKDSSKVLDFFLKEIPNQDYTDEMDKLTELNVQTKDGFQTAHVKHKPSVFGDHVQVSLCGENGCQDEVIDDGLRAEMMKCTFEGTFDSDPESKVTYTNCEEGNFNLNLISSKVDLSSNTYRKVGDEIKERGSKLLLDDLVRSDKEGRRDALYEEEEEEIEHGSDYADNVPKHCCRITKKICTFKNKKLHGCEYKHQPIVCDEKKCSQMRKKHKNLLPKKVKEKLRRENLKDKLNNANKTITQRKPNNEDKNKKETTTKLTRGQKALESKGDKDEENEDGFSIETEEEEDEALKENNLNGGQNDKWKDKNLKELTEGDLESILAETENHVEKKKESYRSNALSENFSNPDSKTKKDNPTERLYNQRTIELGIVIDKYLWQEMQNQMPEADEGAVKKQMMQMVHSLMVSAETFMMHPSISRHGGYRLLIRGLRIWMGDIDKFAIKIHKEKNDETFLEHFREYAEETNEDYDGDAKSFDINMLLTHSKENLGIAPLTDKGMAYIAVACDVNAAMYSTVSLINATHQDNIGALIAHEMGHVLGAGHDGGREKNHNSPKKGETNNCDRVKFIMTPSQKGTITEWSPCSRESIDFEYERREKDMPTNGNCYYT